VFYHSTDQFFINTRQTELVDLPVEIQEKSELHEKSLNSMTQNFRKVSNIKKHILSKFYIRGSVHRNSRLKKSNEIQQYADIYLLLNYSTSFGRPSRPLSGVHKTVVAASGTDHTIWEANFFKRDHVVTFEEACSPDSMICTRGCSYSFMYPDDGRDGSPKHVE
jgi:hypothetical protein